MTDCHKGYIVILSKDLREDDAEAIINALSMIRGVISVEPIINDDPIGDLINRSRINVEWSDALIDLIKSKGGS